MTFYKRHLPHWQPSGSEFFITFRLSGSLPVEAINRVKSYRQQLQKEKDPTIKRKIRRQIFQKYESFLDKTETGPIWLKKKEVAHIVQDAFHFYDGKTYDLYAHCVMPNHAHLVFRHFATSNKNNSKAVYQITDIMHSIKSYTATECNKVLTEVGRSGSQRAMTV